MAKQEPSYLRRHRDAAIQAHEQLTHTRERRNHYVQFWTAIGIWATVIATAGAVFEAWRSGEKQLSEMGIQQKLMQNQLDTMVAQQRPWLSAGAELEMPLMLWDEGAGEPYDFFVPIGFDLKNHGPSPATNVTIYSMLAQVGKSAEWLNSEQERLCTSAEEFSRHQKNGIAVFPGEVSKHGYGIASTGAVVPRELKPLHYIMQGCIDYTYNGDLHGKTAYRIELGRPNEVSHVWEGFRFRFESHELQAESGNTIYRMQPGGISYRETDDGGNWAR